MLFGSALFAIPGIGPVLAAGPIVGWIVAALEVAAVVGGVSAIGAGLYGIGIPKDSVVQYELALQTDKFLLLVHMARSRKSKGPETSSKVRSQPMCAYHIKALTIRATDGEAGTVDEFHFHDEIWAIRYVTIETGGWLGGRQALISPFSITNVDWPAKRLDVALTKAQVENSPDIITHQRVSRQHEAEHLGYFGYPYYWGGPYLWGAEYYPTGKAVPTTFSREAMSE